MHRHLEKPRIAALANDLRQNRLSGDDLERELKALTPEDCVALFERLQKLEAALPLRKISPPLGLWDRDIRR